MTINSTNRKAGPYAGTGMQTAFPFAFKVFTASDMLVVLTDLTNTDITQALTTNYSVALNADQNANPGGTVNMVVAPATGTKLTLGSAVTATQGQSIPNQGGFFPKVIEDALDRVTIEVQQLAEKGGRSLQYPFSDTGAGTQLPTQSARANKALIFDGDGNVTVGASNYNDQVAVTATNAAAAAASAASAQASATSASTSSGNAAQSAAQALYYAQHGTGFTAGTFYDLGSVTDPLTLFPTDLGSVP